QRPAVAVFHPAVRTDKPELPTKCEQRERALYEGDVDVRSIVDGTVASAVFFHQSVWNAFLPHIGRIADDMREGPLDRHQQEISLMQPAIGKLGSSARCNLPH